MLLDLVCVTVCVTALGWRLEIQGTSVLHLGVTKQMCTPVWAVPAAWLGRWSSGSL